MSLIALCDLLSKCNFSFLFLPLIKTKTLCKAYLFSNRNVFCKITIVFFFSSCINDGKFINYYILWKILLILPKKLSINHNLYMVNLDLELLFNNIPLEKTIRNCVNDLFSNKSTRKTSSDLLKLGATESSFIFDNWQSVKSWLTKLTNCNACPPQFNL